jgi:hypothetical protein
MGFSNLLSVIIFLKQKSILNQQDLNLFIQVIWPSDEISQAEFLKSLTDPMLGESKLLQICMRLDELYEHPLSMPTSMPMLKLLPAPKPAIKKLKLKKNKEKAKV